MKPLYICLILLSTSFLNYSQNNYVIASYNILNYPANNDTTIRNPYFRTVISSMNPDILIVEEMTSQAGVNGFLSKVMNSFGETYNAGTFIDGNDADNAIFYKPSKFTFISNTPIHTELRDINEFVVAHLNSTDTLRIFAVHLKASSGSSNEEQRAREVDSLRKVTDLLPANSNYVVLGDFNIYGSTEPAYQKLLNQTTAGYFLDLFTLTGTWNNASYAPYHTQSPRLRDFGGGATGGLDDRFDMILFSPALLASGGIDYITNSFTTYGNDGLHYNDSINSPPNAVVSQLVADGLHYSSDHIPVFASFSFSSSSYVELTFKALIEGFYNGTSMVPDTVTIELRNTSFPYALVDQTKIFLNSSGQGSGKFYNAINGVSYYLVLKHRNAIETWSATGQTFSNDALSYDFTTASNKAYGNNLTLINGNWCIYGGDVNKDGYVETTDLNLVFSDNVSGVTGYVATDLNGDMFIEIEDLNEVFTNNVLGVARKRPIDFPILK
jgi:endonuclease/exonuclease/phosphatase family metal-dependent hydrolase